MRIKNLFLFESTPCSTTPQFHVVYRIYFDDFAKTADVILVFSFAALDVNAITCGLR